MGLGDLPARIERAYDDVKDQRLAMHRALDIIREIEAEAKAEHSDEWASAKNSEVRAVLLDEWCGDDGDYDQARADYDEAKIQFRLATLEIERVRLLVEAAKAEATA
jgi:hypothetical protein